MKEFLEKVKLKGSKRIIENAVIFLILLVILIIVINNLYESEDEVTVPVAITSNEIKNDSLEDKLEKILCMIEGAGNVKVMISYLSSEESIPVFDVTESTTVTEEKDKAEPYQFHRWP